MKFYWRLRHFVWDLREHLFVREVERRMRRTRTLYVHPRHGGSAAWAVVPVEDVAGREDWSHEHAEAAR